MADSTLSTLKSVINALKNDSALVAAIGNRIYTAPPQNPVVPFVHLEVESSPYETKTTQGMEHHVRVHCFSRYDGAKEVADVRARVHQVLHHAALVLDTGTCVNSFWQGSSTLSRSGDDATWRSSATYVVRVVS